MVSTCKDLGYKVGDFFITSKDRLHEDKDAVIQLVFDDGSTCPLFTYELNEYTEGEVIDFHFGESFYLMLEYVKKIEITSEEEREMLEMLYPQLTDQFKRIKVIKNDAVRK